MWLVVCQDGDRDAADLAARLGPVRVEVVTASQLVHGARWEHRIDPTGVARTRLLLADGRLVDPAAVDAVLNRLLWVGADGFSGADDTDRAYAGQEFHALVQSWLAGFGRRVVNRPSGAGLCGTWRGPLGWRAAARAAGLPVRPGPAGAPAPARTVLVVDGAVAGGRSGPVDPAAVRRLVDDLDVDLVELHLDEHGRLGDATLLPRLADHPARVRAVRDALLRRSPPLGDRRTG